MNSFTIAIAAFCLSLSVSAQSPGCEWVNFATGPANDSYVYGSDYDKYGNSFVIGAYSGVTGALDLDPSANSHTVTGNGLWLAKYDPSGAMAWLAPIAIVLTGPQGGIAVPVVACDSFGDVYITGGVKDVTIDFDYMSSSNIPLGTSGGGDMYLAKYSGSGTPLWSFIIGSTSNEQGETIVCDGSKVYVGGFYGINTDFDPDTGTYIPVVPLTCSAGFLAMYTSSGQFVWQNSLQGINQSSYGNCDVMSSAINLNKEILISGIFWGTVDFSPAPTFDTLTVYQPGNNCEYLAKYDSTGAFIFTKRIDNHTGIVWADVTVDHANNIVLAGYFDGITDFDLGAGAVLDTGTAIAYPDCFIAKYDNAGNYLWHGTFGSNTYDFINDIAIDDNNNILVGGTTRGQIDADMGPAVYNLAVNGNCNGCDDAFVTKYSSTGQLLFGFSVSAWANDGLWSVGCFEDRISITGVFSGIVDFDPSADTMMVTPAYVNGYNYYHAQYFDSTFVSGISSASGVAESFYVYPNPSSDFIRIENFDAFDSYAIVNVAGQMVQTGKQTQTIDVRNLAAGTYLLTLTDKNGLVARTKFVKR